MKTITNLLLIALLIGSNGCVTSATIKRAKGYTDERVEPLKGDTVFNHGGIEYVIQQQHPTGKGAEKMPISGPYYAFEPSPGCYALTPLTVTMDIATSPFQLIGLGLWALFLQGQGNLGR